MREQTNFSRCLLRSSDSYRRSPVLAWCSPDCRARPRPERSGRTSSNGMTITAHTSEMTLGSIRGVLESHVAHGYASGVVALVGQGEASHVLTIGAKALGAADPM